MARHKDTDWTLPDKLENWPQAHVAVLMDIRDELKALNRVFSCYNFQRIPTLLDTIARESRRQERLRLKRLAAKRLAQKAKQAA